MLVCMERRLGKRRLKPEKEKQVMLFLAEEPAIRLSPLEKDTLLTRGEDGEKNVRVPRMLCESKCCGSPTRLLSRALTRESCESRVWTVGLTQLYLREMHNQRIPPTV